MTDENIYANALDNPMTIAVRTGDTAYVFSFDGKGWADSNHGKRAIRRDRRKIKALLQAALDELPDRGLDITTTYHGTVLGTAAATDRVDRLNLGVA